jgi:hypothetical protein
MLSLAKLHAASGTRTYWKGNKSILSPYRGPGQAWIIEGDADFDGNKLETEDSAAIIVKGTAKFQGNAVLFPGHGGLALFYGENTETKFKSRYTYGFFASGDVARLTYGNNHFHTWKDWGSPVGKADGSAAVVEDAGGNKIISHGSSSTIKPDRER